jgi:hypothetical protein
MLAMDLELMGWLTFMLIPATSGRLKFYVKGIEQRNTNLVLGLVVSMLIFLEMRMFLLTFGAPKKSPKGFEKTFGMWSILLILNVRQFIALRPTQ